MVVPISKMKKLNKEMLDVVLKSIEACKEECFKKLEMENLVNKIQIIDKRLNAGIDACTNGKIIWIDIESILFNYRNWDERIIHCIAHESRHVWQFYQGVTGDMWWRTCWEEYNNTPYNLSPLEKDAEEWASFFMSL